MEEIEQRREKRERIAMLEENKAFNRKLYQQGKRDRETYLTCREDAQNAINEIKNGER